MEENDMVITDEQCIYCKGNKYFIPWKEYGYVAICLVCGTKYYYDYTLTLDPPGIEWFMVLGSIIDKESK